MNGNHYLLDTNIIVPFLNGDQEIIKNFKKLAVVQIPFVVLGELYFGAYKSSNTEQNVSTIKEFVSTHCEIFYPRGDTLEVYGRIKQILSKKGKPIPENDIWIAALAVEYDTTLVTRDKHFNNISDIKLEVW